MMKKNNGAENPHFFIRILLSFQGQEEFNRLRTLSYEGTHVFMLCFSVDDRDSLDNIPTKWVHEVYDHVPDAKVVLVALKCDLRDDDSMVLKLQQEGRGRPVMYEEVSFSHH